MTCGRSTTGSSVGRQSEAARGEEWRAGNHPPSGRNRREVATVPIRNIRTRQHAGLGHRLRASCPILCAAAALSLAGAGSLPAQEGAEPTSALTYQPVPGPSLAGNLAGEAAYRNVIVYLPPSYLSSTRRYPVLYLLHGYNIANTSWIDGTYQGFGIQEAMDRLIGEGHAREMLVVMPDARTWYGGSYYTDSPVSGNWEQFITRDLVGYVDSRYRTLANPVSRGIVGWSMDVWSLTTG
jgi:hypothetical protein